MKHPLTCHTQSSCSIIQAFTIHTPHTMKQIKSNFLFLSLVVLLLLLNSNSSRAQEAEDEREFDYTEGSEKGPSHWGDLKQEWATCKKGKMQSPIDLSHERVKIIRRAEMRNYKPTNATITNRGHDIMVEWVGDAGSIFMNGNEYALKQAHWHSPSEHTVNGRRYDLELHMVHQSINKDVKNNVSVVGVLYKIGKPDKFLSKLMRSISSMIDQEDAKRQLELIDPRKIKTAKKKHHRYIGSLTVPPCTEGVIWTINKKVRTVSRDQVKLLREAVHDYAERNARPLQPHNNRDVYFIDSAS